MPAATLSWLGTKDSFAAFPGRSAKKNKNDNVNIFLVFVLCGILYLRRIWHLAVVAKPVEKRF